MHIRYRPRIKFGLGSLGITRESIDYVTAYAPRTSTLTTTSTMQPLEPPPVISVPISPPASFYEQTVQAGGGMYTDPSHPFYSPPGSGGGFPTMDVTMPLDTAFIPEQFVYSKDQILDMLARGASETFERSGETDSGLPVDMELEQKSRELDATKDYVINADGAIIPLEPEAPGGGLALLAAAVAAFFLFGG